MQPITIQDLERYLNSDYIKKLLQHWDERIEIINDRMVVFDKIVSFMEQFGDTYEECPEMVTRVKLPNLLSLMEKSESIIYISLGVVIILASYGYPWSWRIEFEGERLWNPGFIKGVEEKLSDTPDKPDESEEDLMVVKIEPSKVIGEFQFPLVLDVLHIRNTDSRKIAVGLDGFNNYKLIILKDRLRNRKLPSLEFETFTFTKAEFIECIDAITSLISNVYYYSIQEECTGYEWRDRIEKYRNK
jgi:hypothetical protein